MRKRQVKKFAKRAKKNMVPYRQAYGGAGSKKLQRRKLAFWRYQSAETRQARVEMNLAMRSFLKITADVVKFIENRQSVVDKIGQLGA